MNLFTSGIPTRKRRPGGSTMWKLPMKLTAFLILIVSTQAGAGGFAQTITLNENNASLEKVFSEIKKQTNYVFFYEQKTLENTSNVSIHVKNADITNVLLFCLKGQPLSFTISGNFIGIKRENVPTEKAIALQSDQAPPPTKITGRVMDSDNNPVAGASVTIKGTSIGTVTGSDGRFTLTYSRPSGTLTISHVGQKTTEIAFSGDNPDLKITLAFQSQEQQDVVVVAYGTQKKINLTGAVDQISGTQIQNRPVPNISSALQGQMANLNVFTNGSGGQPDAIKTLNIRGFTGLGTALGPLVLIDGVPADINSVNPDDVESITMLKDIASAAIYGSRAPNGVLLITTKHGKKGQPMRISYNDNFSWTNPINNPQTMNSYDFANYYNEAATNAGQGIIFSQSYLSMIAQYMNHPGSIPVVQPTPDSSGWNSKVNGVANTDWYDVMMKKNVLNEQHNISLDGGSDKVTYHVGAGEQQQNANLNFSNGYTYKRYNFRANMNADVTKWMTFGAETVFAQTTDKVPYANDLGYNWYYEIPRMWPTWTVYAPNGGLLGAYLTSMGPYRYQAYQLNDGWLKGKLDIKPLPGWLVHGDYAYNFNTQNSQNYQGQAYASTPRNPDTLETPNVVNFTRTANFNHFHSYNIYTSYEKNIGPHYFQALVGQQEEYQYYSSFSAYNTNLYDPNFPSLTLSYGTPPQVSDAGSAWATFGTFGRVNYNYDGKYLVEFNGRYMGTSLFPANTRYAFFKSASAGWNISKETFFDRWSKTVTNLKLRASYGVTGDISYFLSNSSYYPYIANLGTKTPGSITWLFSGPTTDSRQPAVTAPGLVSSTLTWAKPSMLDLGVDIDFLHDYSIVFDWYDKTIRDLFGPPATYPSTLGATPPQVNDATVQTRGFDLTVNWHHTFGKVGLMARGILSNYKGKVISYVGNAAGLLSTWYNGESMGTIWGYKTVGKFQSQAQIDAAPSQKFFSNLGWAPGDIQYADLNHDGVINNGNNTLQNHGDLMIIGNSTPQYLYGFTLGANYKGIDVSVFMQGVGGGQYFSSANTFWGSAGQNSNGSDPLKTLEDRWTPTNPNGYFPRALFSSTQNEQPQTGYLLSLAYWRLKNVAIGYALPAAMISRIHLSKARFYASIDNVMTIAPELKHSYIDPELLNQSNGNGGIAGQVYPLMRAVSVGVQVSIQ